MRTRAEAVVDRCFQTVPKARFGPLAAGGVLAVAAKLDLVARLLAVIAAVLPVEGRAAAPCTDTQNARIAFRRCATTHLLRGTLLHLLSRPPRPAVPVGLDESVIWDRKWRARILPDQCPSESSRLRLYPFQEGNIDPERPPKAGGRCATIGRSPAAPESGDAARSRDPWDPLGRSRSTRGTRHS